MENAILAELQKFILEMGSDFASIGQYEGTNYYLIFEKGPLPKVWATARLKTAGRPACRRPVSEDKFGHF